MSSFFELKYSKSLRSLAISFQYVALSGQQTLVELHAK